MLKHMAAKATMTGERRLQQDRERPLETPSRVLPEKPDAFIYFDAGLSKLTEGGVEISASLGTVKLGLTE